MEQFDDQFYLGEQIAGYLKGELSPAKVEAFENWLAEDAQHRELFERLVSKTKLQDDFAAYANNNKATAWARIKNETGFVKKSTRSFYIIRYGVVASIFLCLSIGGYLLLHKKSQQQFSVQQIQDIAPGSNQAILKTSGKTIILAAAKNGVITQNGQTLIKKSSDGLISYSGTLHNRITIYDTITIPRKGQHVLVFADGSKVWLNAASQLRFPEQFKGNERRVELLYGEAYFEIVHNANMPFRVVSGEQVIEDIGTKFNVNAYPDESSSKTTLVEGSISINHKILKPGQQAVVSGNNLNIINTDTEAVTAWKDGDFIFKDEDFKTVMRKVARWYDVEVIYAPSVSIDHIPGGWVSRCKPISAVLRMMEETGKVHFQIQGRRITVTK